MSEPGRGDDVESVVQATVTTTVESVTVLGLTGCGGDWCCAGETGEGCLGARLGQLISIAQNSAPFSLLGTVCGGDG